MVQSIKHDWFQVGIDLEPHHLFCWFVTSFVFSFDGGRVWGCAIFRRPQESIDVECTNSTLRKQNPRTIPPLCCHCFEWKPKPFPIKLLFELRYWWMMKSPSLLCILGSRILIASVESLQWNCDNLLSEIWLVSDPSSGVRSVSVQFQLLLLLIAYCWCIPEATMASKEGKKQKKSYKNTLLNRSDLASSNKTNQTGSASNQNPSSSLEEAHLFGIKEACPRTADPSKKFEKGLFLFKLFLSLWARLIVCIGSARCKSTFNCNIFTTKIWINYLHVKFNPANNPVNWTHPVLLKAKCIHWVFVSAMAFSFFRSELCCLESKINMLSVLACYYLFLLLSNSTCVSDLSRPYGLLLGFCGAVPWTQDCSYISKLKNFCNFQWKLSILFECTGMCYYLSFVLLDFKDFSFLFMYNFAQDKLVFIFPGWVMLLITKIWYPTLSWFGLLFCKGSILRELLSGKNYVGFLLSEIKHRSNMLHSLNLICEKLMCVSRFSVWSGILNNQIKISVDWFMGGWRYRRLVRGSAVFADCCFLKSKPQRSGVLKWCFIGTSKNIYRNLNYVPHIYEIMAFSWHWILFLVISLLQWAIYLSGTAWAFLWFPLELFEWMRLAVCLVFVQMEVAAAYLQAFPNFNNGTLCLWLCVSTNQNNFKIIILVAYSHSHIYLCTWILYNT